VSTPYPIARRIPEDQPFVVRPDLRKRGIQFGVVGAVLIVLFTVLLLSGADEFEGGVRGVLRTSLGAAIVLGALFGGLVWLLSGGGPVLAAGPAGLWIRTRPTRGQAIWLPWEAISHIRRGRWGVERLLIIHPLDPSATDLGTLSWFDTRYLRAWHGSGLIAAVKFVDRTENEIRQAVAYYAANRVLLR
jgi:hypothetical protein